MKLLTRTTLYFLCAMIPLLAAGGYLLFSQFSREINSRVDKELVYDEIQWIQYLRNVASGGTNYVLRSPDILIRQVDAAPFPYPQISDVTGDGTAGEKIPFRQLSHIVSINGNPYQIIIRKSQEQKAALVSNITWIMLLVFIGLFLVTLLFNWIINKTLWQPFRVSLHKIRNIELEKMESLYFESTTIKEFNELNAALNTMTRKIGSDYLNMKEFTENAAHEMQTPLAVAQTKMELLLQDPGLKEAQLETISEASLALNRLSKLNQSLLLLAKIENHQYETNETIGLAETTKKYLHLFEEIIQDKQLSVATNFEADLAVTLHPFLADTLISNLLGNAIKYNFRGGTVTVETSCDQYCISNTSQLPAINPDQLFKRFNLPHNKQESSTGLGLAIVKRIADTHRLHISYQHTNDSHRFCLRKTDA